MVKQNKVRLNTTLDQDVFTTLKNEAEKEGHNKINKIIERITRENLIEGKKISSIQLEKILNEFKEFIEQKFIEQGEPIEEVIEKEVVNVLKKMKHNF